MKVNLIFLLIVFLFVPLESNWAEKSPSSIIINEQLDLNFTPKSVYFLLADSSGLIKKTEGSIASFGREESGEGTLTRYLIGTEVPNKPGSLFYSILIFGENGAYDFVSPQKIESEKTQYVYNSSQDLHDLVIKKRALLTDRLKNLNDQTMTLKKLRVSAAGVTEIGKIIEIEEETKRIHDAANELQGDIETLRQALESVKTIPQPHKFEQRKSQLTGQLSEMAQAALLAEQGASKRKKSADIDLEKKLSLIDSTRFDDLDDLEREYRALTGNSEDLAAEQGSTNESGNLDSENEKPLQDSQDLVPTKDYFSLSEG